MRQPAPTYWRSLEELAGTPEFAAMVEQEAPRFRDIVNAFDRRRFLQLMAASLALGGLSGCGPEPNPRQLLPYVEEPENVVPGRNRYYASAATLDGYATGVLVAHQMARPIKVEGNPDHPASLGAASAIMQASILQLYDPRHAQTIVGNGQIATWEAFVGTLHERRGSLLARKGEGLRILTGAVSSPSLAAQLAKVVPVVNFEVKPGEGAAGELFWVFYWVATGLHAIHLTVGIGLVLYMLLWRIRRGEITSAYYAPLEAVGIYWSFVDAVWLFLFPSIYLLGRS